MDGRKEVDMDGEEVIVVSGNCKDALGHDERKSEPGE
jgi:hypothetical protein